jgi:hypothetical protein
MGLGLLPSAFLLLTERKPELRKIDGNAVAFHGQRYVLIYSEENPLTWITSRCA